MAVAEQTRDRLSPSERAVCYFTLPRLLSPVSLALMLGYFVCLALAASVLVAGIRLDNHSWIRVSTYALALLVPFGLVVFFLRALLNDIRGRRALRRAMAAHVEEGEDGLPDLFAGHVLLKHPMHTEKGLYSCTRDDGAIVYFVEKAVGGRRWRVRNAHYEEVCRIEALHGVPSFSFLPEPLRRLKVVDEEGVAAEVFPVASLKTTAADIHCTRPATMDYRVKRNGIYREKRLVGRIYSLRQHVYLDIEEAHLHPGVLAYFIANS